VSDVAVSLDQAIALHRAGRMLDAERLYRQILAVDAANPDVLYLLGAACHAQGKPYDAAAFLEQAVRIQPAHFDARYLLGVVLTQQDRPEQAVPQLQEAARLRPDSQQVADSLRMALAASHTNAGMAAAEQGRVDTALAHYREALSAVPNYVAAIGNMGNALKVQGRLDEAADCYRQILTLAPQAAQPHNDLGLIAQAQDRIAEAINHFRRALQLDNRFAEAHTNLGTALFLEGRLDEAEACCRRALELRPEFADAHSDLGAVLLKGNRPVEAAESFRRAIQFQPRVASAHFNLGRALTQLKNLDEAAECFRRALEIEPDHAEAHSRLALILKEQRRLTEALGSFRLALKLNPDYVDALNGLGTVLSDLKQFDEAIECYRRALAIKPDYPDAHNNLGAALSEQNKFDEAIACYRRALELKGDYYAGYYNIADALVRQARLAEAEVVCRRALELNPDSADAHGLFSLILLGQGKLVEGWPEYEWRFLASNFKYATPAQPRWDGSPLEGRTVLLCSEQGHGDTLQFIRYAELVKQKGGNVVAECPAATIRLVAGCAGVGSVVEFGKPRPHFDFYLPMLSLPGVFGTSLETIPARVPYLAPDPMAAAQWKEEFSREQTFKVGISWQGNPDYRRDSLRSVPLVHFSELVQVPGVQVYSLQMGAGREQLTQSERELPIVDLADRLGDFYNTAAIISNLDLVISSDCATVHLAGALGVPVWVAMSFAPDWRWLLAREDCPWYPTMRLFRQSSPGDWPGVFRRIHAALLEHVGK
jgi:tetratricopeptide (TPR) repeat protein